MSKQHKQLFLTFLGGIRVLVSTSSFLFVRPTGSRNKGNNGGDWSVPYPKTIGKTGTLECWDFPSCSASDSIIKAQPLGLNQARTGWAILSATNKWYLWEGFSPPSGAPFVFHISPPKKKLPGSIIDSKKKNMDLFWGGLCLRPLGDNYVILPFGIGCISKTNKILVTHLPGLMLESSVVESDGKMIGIISPVLWTYDEWSGYFLILVFWVTQWL